MVKTYYAHIYGDSAGTQFISTVKDFVLNNFSWSMNGGLGECSLRFARKWNDFGENVDIKMSNRVDIFVNDMETAAAFEGGGLWDQIIYSGYIVEYSPTLMDSQEYVDVTLWGYSTLLATQILLDGSSTTKSYSTIDPSDIINNALGSLPSPLTLGFINDTGTEVTYEFRQNTLLDVINQCQAMAPAWWYWRCGADNKIIFDIRDTNVINHHLRVGLDVQSITVTRSTKSLYNRYYFLGGDVGGSPMYIVNDHVTSQNAYGLRVVANQDERLTDVPTATAVTEAYLTIWDHPSIFATMVVADSNGSTGGYDIESFKPGDVISITDPQQDSSFTLWDVAQWDVDFWDFNITSAIGVPFMITDISYELDQATLQLAYQTFDGSKRIQDIKRSLYYYRTHTTPATPPTPV
jgi:hypothetical protein